MQIIDCIDTKYLCVVFSNFKKKKEKEGFNYFHYVSITYHYTIDTTMYRDAYRIAVKTYR